MGRTRAVKICGLRRALVFSVTKQRASWESVVHGLSASGWGRGRQRSGFPGQREAGANGGSTCAYAAEEDEEEGDAEVH